MLEPQDESHYFNRLIGEDNLFCILHPLHTSQPPVNISDFDFRKYETESEVSPVQLAQPLADGVPIACSAIVTNYRVILIVCHSKRVPSPAVPLPAPEGPPNPKRFHKTRKWEFTERPSSSSTDESQNPRGYYHANLSHAIVFIIPHTSLEYSKVDPKPPEVCVTLSTKFVSHYKLLFKDASHGTKFSQLLNSLQAHDLGHLPAFDYFKSWMRAAQKAEGESADAHWSPEMDFGWSVYQDEREYERQLTLNNHLAIPLTSELQNAGRSGRGYDLRPWFRLSTIGDVLPDTTDDSALSLTPLIGGPGASPTYPTKICVPNAATDKFLIAECLEARSRGRIPAISYVNLRTGAVLARASQPLRKNLGSDGKLCEFLFNYYTVYNCNPHDEQPPLAQVDRPSIDRKGAAPPSLIEPTFPRPTTHKPSPAEGGPVSGIVGSPGCKFLNVVDCRPKTAAMGNNAVGGGFENYSFCRIKFHNIENIHAVNSSFLKLKALVSAFYGKNQRADFLYLLNETGWFTHLSRLLTCVSEVVSMMDRGESCLVHCTDGWDRTSQVTALAMLLTDPYYRTVQGFACLVEKEFAAFGHKFAERLGHMRQGITNIATDSGVASSDVEPASNHKLQPCPIFPQFLDAVHQLLVQFPDEFEFTSSLLEYLLEHCHSCFYGTFLCNAQKERLLEGVPVGTASIWTDIILAAHLERTGLRSPFLLNPTYHSEEAARSLLRSTRDLPLPLAYNPSSKLLHFWEAMYFRDDPSNWGTHQYKYTRKCFEDILGLSVRLAGHLSSPLLSLVNVYRNKLRCEDCDTFTHFLKEDDKEYGVSTIKYHPAFVQWCEDEMYVLISHRRVDYHRHAEIKSQFRLQVKPASPVNTGLSRIQPTGVGAGATKQCWICHDSFGIFATKHYCSECNIKAPICSDCVQTDANGKKLCRNCFAIKGRH